MNRFDRDILFQETIRRESRGYHKLKKQRGGPGHFAIVDLVIRPLPRGGGCRFVDSVVEARIPAEFIRPVEKGARAALAKGPLGGFPVVDIEVELRDGEAHERDSHAPDFQTAGMMAVRAAMAEARPAILEPFGLLSVACPVPSIGFVLGRLAARRARVRGTDFRDGSYEVQAEIPLIEARGFEAELRSATRDEARCALRPSGYDVMPEALRAALFA